MSTGKKMLRGTVMNLTDQILRFTAVFIVTPVIVRNLGPENYGLWALLMSILGHYAYLDFGLSPSLARFFAEAIGKGDKSRLHRLFNTSLSLLIRLGGAGLLLAAIAFASVPFFTDDPEVIQSSRRIIALYGIYLSAGFPIRVLRALLKSQLRFDLLVIASATQIVVANVLIFIFMKAGYGILALAVINVGAGFLEYGIVLIAGYLNCKGVPISRKHFDRGLQREIVKYSKVSFVTSIGTGLRAGVDPIVLGCYGLIAEITFYSIGTRFPLYLTDLVGAVMGGQLLAYLSQVYGKSGRGETVERYLSAIRMSTIVAVFFGSAMMVYGDAFITRWMGEGHGDSYRVMAILCVPYILALMQYPSLSLLYTLAKHRYIATTMIVGGIINLALSFILANFYGLYGVVWATFIEMSVVYLIVFPLIAAKAGEVPVGRIYVNALGIPLLLSMGILVPYYLVAQSWISPDYSRLVILGLLQGAIFFPLAIRFILSRDERGALWEAIRGKSKAGGIG